MAKKKKFNYKKAEPSGPPVPQPVPTSDEFPTLGVPVTQPQTQPQPQPQPQPDPQPSTSQPIASTSGVRVEPRLEPIVTQTTDSDEGSTDPNPGPSGQTERVPTDGTEDKKLEDLAKELSELVVMTPKPIHRPFPKRPNYLSEDIGITVPLLANHFLLKVGSKQAFHYDLEIERAPKELKIDPNIVDKDVEESTVKEKSTKYTRKMATKLNRKVFQQMIETNSRTQSQVFFGINPVFDGQKNMFTSKVLKGTGGQNEMIRLKVDLNEEGRVSTFYVNIKLTETNSCIDLNILNQYHSGRTCDDDVVKKSVLFINTLLRHNSTMSLIPIGQSIFDPKIPGQQISQFILMSYGYYTSVRNLMIGPTLNVNRSVACFYNTIGIDTIVQHIIKGQLSSVPKLTDYQRRQIKRELAGLQVEATHISYGNSYRKYRIIGVSEKSAKDHTFKWIEGEKDKGLTSVVDYFKLKYQIDLKYKHLPCLEVGNTNNKVYLPFEVCKIVSHQRLRRSMTNEERSQLTQAAGSQSPKARLDMCSRFVTEQFHTGELAQRNRPFLSEFEINVSNNLLKVDSKLIGAPALKYAGNRSVNPNDGEWEMWKAKAKFLKAASLQKWIIINISFSAIDDQSIGMFARDLSSQASEMGMAIVPQSVIAKIPDIKEFDPKTTFNGIKKRIKSFNNLQMILFITPVKSHAFSDDIYSEIKILGDIEEGLTTQCVNIANIWNERSRDRPQKWNRSYLRQLMLKVNPKLGGTNVALLETSSMPSIFKNKSLMIVGADVNHPAPADRITPSIAAVVGSYDNEYSNYYTTVSMQPKSREEMIKNLDQMVVELLKKYQREQKRLPQSIVFYRDGVSEGQFQHVIDNEYPLLLKAFSAIDSKYKPKITFIVVQKRHHSRFMTTKGLNVCPGTVVESDITHKTDFDFYLCSHSGRIGTSRSAHYYVLADENGFNSNDMCKMTYYLCHIYQRCTKSVSIPAPVYYADLAAYRAKVHASGFQSTGSDVRSVVSSLDGGGDREEVQIKSFKDIIKVTDNQKQRLYFC